MSANISANHPIRQLFFGLVQQTFTGRLGESNPDLTRYLSDVLVDFTHRDHLFRIRNAHGVNLEEIAEMLVEGDVALNATSFEREREVHKHIGDFTLFWTGVYPEMLKRLRAPSRRDHLIDYVAQGRKSYQIASTFEYGPYAQEAGLMRQLADRFEVYMHGLQLVRRELDAYGTPESHTVRRLLES
ncbi:MAG: hypothetical protein ACO1SX_27555 [Actinomycetota bacterium]